MRLKDVNRIKRSDLLLTALNATESKGLENTTIVDTAMDSSYILEWLALLEDSSRLKECESDLLDVLKTKHSDCDFRHESNENDGGGYKLTVEIRLPN